MLKYSQNVWSSQLCTFFLHLLMYSNCPPHLNYATTLPCENYNNKIGQFETFCWNNSTISCLNKAQFVQHTPDLWPTNSTHLNPVDYCVSSILQEKVYGTRFTNIDELKCKLLREWAKLDHEIIASAIRQWRRRLRAWETADGGHFEQAFWAC